MRSLAAIALAAWASGSGGCGAVPATVSGAAEPLTLVAAEYDPLTKTLLALNDGARLHLQVPPQGGIVAFVGARAHHMLTGDATVHARLSVGGVLLGEEARATRLTRTDDGSYAIETDSFVGMANVPVCPGSDVDAVDADASLEVTLTERGTGRSATQIVAVHTACDQPNEELRAFCQCVCAPAYAPGKCN